jgi:hypothetical protein
MNRKQAWRIERCSVREPVGDVDHTAKYRSINGFLKPSSVKFPTKNTPAHGIARRKSRLFRPAHRALPASLAPLPRQGRASGQPIPCPGIMPTASG